MPPQNLIPVDILGLVEEGPAGGSILILVDDNDERILPIVIGNAETQAIIVSLNNLSTPRPLTHQLVLQTINKFKAGVEKVVIEKMENNTFYASLHLRHGADQLFIDARPSDAIAIALEAEVPMYVAEEVFLKSSHLNPFNLDLMPKPSRPTEQKPIKKAQFTDLNETEVAKLRDLLEKARQLEESGGEDKSKQ